MRQTLSALAISAVMATSGCAYLASVSGPSGPFSGPGSYCQLYPSTCVLIGAAVLAGAILVFDIFGTAGAIGHMYPYPYPVMSDARLKQDAQRIATLDNGIDIYSYRFIGDDRVFVGVMAQELQRDARFADAVSAGPDGYLQVDYARLQIKLHDGEVMQEAGLAARNRALAR